MKPSIRTKKRYNKYYTMAQTRIYGGGDKAVEETAEVAEKTTEDAEETTEEAEETTEEAEETAEATTHKDKTKPGKATLCCFFLLNLPSHSQQP